MKQWSKMWKSSKKPTKQRKYREEAPFHVRGHLLHSHLAKPLQEKTKKRSIRVRRGDVVKIMRGTFKGKIGKVDRVNVKNECVYVVGVETLKKDGSKSWYPLHPSNLLIQELETDKRRLQQ